MSADDVGALQDGVGRFGDQLAPLGARRVRGVGGEDPPARSALVGVHVETIAPRGDVILRRLADDERAPFTVAVAQIAIIDIGRVPTVLHVEEQPAAVARQVGADEGLRVAGALVNQRVAGRGGADAMKANLGEPRPLGDGIAGLDGK